MIEPLILYALETRPIAGKARSSPGEGNPGTPCKNRTEINVDLVDLSFIQCLAQNIAATFNENACDIFLAEIPQDKIQRLSSVDQGLVVETVGKDSGATR